MTFGVTRLVDKIREELEDEKRKKKFREGRDRLRDVEARQQPPAPAPAPPARVEDATGKPAELMRRVSRVLTPAEPTVKDRLTKPERQLAGVTEMMGAGREALGKGQEVAARVQTEQAEAFQKQWASSKTWAEERGGKPLTDEEFAKVVEEAPQMFPQVSGWEKPNWKETFVRNIATFVEPEVKKGPPAVQFLSSPAGAASLIAPPLRAATLLGLAGEEAAGTVAQAVGAPKPVEIGARIAGGVLMPGAGIISGKGPRELVAGLGRGVTHARPADTALEVTRRVAAGESLADVGVRELYDASGIAVGKELKAIAQELSQRGSQALDEVTRRVPGTGALAPLMGGEEGFLRVPFLKKAATSPDEGLLVIGTAKGVPVAGRVAAGGRIGRRFIIHTPDGQKVAARRGALGLAKSEEAAKEFLERAAKGEPIEALMAEYQTPVSKMVNALRTATRLQAEVAPEIHARRVGGHASIQGVLRSGRYAPLEKYKVATGTLKGMPRRDMPPLSQYVSEQDMTELVESIDRHFGTYAARGYDWNNAGRAFSDLYLEGTKPMPAQRRLLAEVFGDELLEVLSHKTFTQAALSNMWEAMNIPRAVLASYDLSAPLRQGVMLLPGHPKESIKAFGAMVRAFAREDAAKVVDEAIKSTPTYSLKQEAKLYLAPLAGELEEREEVFMSHLARKIPGVARSERAYVTYLNKLRSDVFDTVHGNWVGKPGIGMEDYTALADFINKASGRGSLGPMNANARYLSALFFAPRFAVSRPQAFFSMLSKSPAARRLAIRDMTMFVGTGVAALGLMKTAAEAFDWDMTVELDPRSTDFGKLKIGETRLDFWGGTQQWVRYLAQLLPTDWHRLDVGPVPFALPETGAGLRKAGSGFIYEVDKPETAFRFLRSKFSPQAGFLYDWWSGTTFIGDEMMLDPGSVKTQAFNRFVPMMWQDVIDSVRMNGWHGAWTALPAGLGMGTLTYKTPFDEVIEARGEAMDQMGVTQFEYDTNLGIAARVDNHSVVKEARARLDKDTLLHGGNLASLFYAQARDIQRDREVAQLKRDDLLEKGLMDKSDWKYVSQEDASKAYLAIEGMRGLAGIEPGDRDVPPSAINDAVTAFFAVDETAEKYIDETGRIDYYAFHKDQSATLAHLTPEQRKDALMALHKNATPRMRLMYEDIDWLAQTDWFGIPEWLWKQVAPDMIPLDQLVINERKKLVEANQGQDITDDETWRWMKANIPEVKEYDRRLQPTEYNERMNKPEAEARAYRAGLVDKILNPQAAIIYYLWTGKIPDDFEQPPTGFKGRAYRREDLEEVRGGE